VENRQLIAHMTSTRNDHALHLLDHASTLERTTKQKRRGRPEGAEVSKRLLLRAFIRKSEMLLSELRQKWGFPLPPEVWANPDFLKDELASRNPSLTTTDFVEITRISRRTVVTLLPELVKNGSLHFTIIRKTKVYKPRSLEECRQPLRIEGSRSRRERQVERLQKLGLDVAWVTTGRLLFLLLYYETRTG